MCAHPSGNVVNVYYKTTTQIPKLKITKAAKPLFFLTFRQWVQIDSNYRPQPYQGCALTKLSYAPRTRYHATQFRQHDKRGHSGARRYRFLAKSYPLLRNRKNGITSCKGIVLIFFMRHLDKKLSAIHIH